ncbi:MAG: hypothetical protein ABIH42_10465, partial [Planctomycetota bacterium]
FAIDKRQIIKLTVEIKNESTETVSVPEKQGAFFISSYNIEGDLNVFIARGAIDTAPTPNKDVKLIPIDKGRTIKSSSELAPRKRFLSDDAEDDTWLYEISDIEGVKGFGTGTYFISVSVVVNRVLVTSKPVEIEVTREGE